MYLYKTTTFPHQPLMSVFKDGCLTQVLLYCIATDQNSGWSQTYKDENLT